MIAVAHAETRNEIARASLQVSAETNGADWDRFLERHPAATVEHLWAFREVFTSVFGQECVYLAARRGDEIVGVLPLVKFRSIIFGRALVSLPYANYAGLVTSDAEAAQALVDSAGSIGREFRATHVELRNVERHLPDLPCRQHKVGARLSLPLTSEALWAALDRKVRNQVRKAQKEELTTEQGGTELVEDFYSVFATNMRDLGTPVFPKGLFTETLRRLPSHARVFVVRKGTLPVAAAVALAWKDTVLVPWASSLREHRHLSPNMLLYWSMLEAAVIGGHRVFDFGRSTPDGGTHHFKQQWKATDFPLHWEYLLLTGAAAPDHGTTNPKMQFLIDAWKRLPLGVANRIGPAIIRHIS